MLNLAVRTVTSGLYKAKPNWYWRPAPQAASVPLLYNPPPFLFLILQEFEAMNVKHGFIISTSFLSPHREISFAAAQLDRDVCISCVNYTRLSDGCC